MGSDAKPTAYVPNPMFSQEDWDEVADNPELTDADFAKSVPLREAMPELVEAVRRRGAQKAATKALVSLRIDRDVLEAFRSSGAGWQARMNAALRKSAGL